MKMFSGDFNPENPKTVNNPENPKTVNNTENRKCSILHQLPMPKQSQADEVVILLLKKMKFSKIPRKPKM